MTFSIRSLIFLTIVVAICVRLGIAYPFALGVPLFFIGVIVMGTPILLAGGEWFAIRFAACAQAVRRWIYR